MQASYYWTVELETGVWLAPWDGDPGRTLARENATGFGSRGEAETAMASAREHRPFARAAVKHVKSVESVDATGLGACGHPMRYMYDGRRDPDDPREGSCALCDLRETRLRLRLADGPTRPPCYFALVTDPTEDTCGWFHVATKEFWDEYGHLDDSDLTATVRLRGFTEVMESVFEFDGGTPEEGRVALLAAGLTENTAMLP